MTISKSILYTIFFFLFVQLTAIWVILNSFLDIQFLINDYNYFVSGMLEITGVILFFFLMKKQKSLIQKNTPIVYCLFAVVLGVLYVFAQKWLNYIYDVFANTDFANQTTYNLDFSLDKFTLNTVAIIVLLPISEELFFRSYIQNGLQKNYKPLISIGVSSLLFSLLHLPNVHYTYLVFFGGLISAMLYHKSRSIAPSIVFHMIWNIIVLIN